MVPSNGAGNAGTHLLGQKFHTVNRFWFDTIMALKLFGNVSSKPYKMPATNNTADASAANRNVLIIEDEAEMCLLLNLVLDHERLTIEHVKTLAAADAYLERRLPALILLDNRLPDGLGLDYLLHLKKNYPWIKVIVISGVDAAAGDVALEVGADAFLKKPFTKAALLASVNSLIN